MSTVGLLQTRSWNRVYKNGAEVGNLAPSVFTLPARHTATNQNWQTINYIHKQGGYCFLGWRGFRLDSKIFYLYSWNWAKKHKMGQPPTTNCRHFWKFISTYVQKGTSIYYLEETPLTVHAFSLLIESSFDWSLAARRGVTDVGGLLRCWAARATQLAAAALGRNLSSQRNKRWGWEEFWPFPGLTSWEAALLHAIAMEVSCLEQCRQWVVCNVLCKTCLHCRISRGCGGGVEISKSIHQQQQPLNNN